MNAGPLLAQAMILFAVTGLVVWAVALGWALALALIGLTRGFAALARRLGRRIDRASLRRAADGAGETLAALLLVAGGAVAVGLASTLTP